MFKDVFDGIFDLAVRYSTKYEKAVDGLSFDYFFQNFYKITTNPGIEATAFKVLLKYLNNLP